MITEEWGVRSDNDEVGRKEVYGGIIDMKIFERRKNDALNLFIDGY